MNDLHLFENSGTVISDEDLAFGILDHLVHTAGTKGSSDDISHSSCCDNVCHSDVFSLLGV